jgi:hypothetical protein
MFKREREKKNRYMIPGQKRCIDVRQCKEREKEEEEEASSAIITVRTKEDQGRKTGGATKRKTRQ